MKHINGGSGLKLKVMKMNKSMTGHSRISECKHPTNGKPPDTMLDYLADLNPQQRRAVEYGVKPGNAKDVGPLLVIAGAGSGKTKTLAHRVAHLIINGIDPHRIYCSHLRAGPLKR